MPIPIDGLGVRRVRARLSFGALMAAIALPLPAAALDLSLGQRDEIRDDSCQVSAVEPIAN